MTEQEAVLVLADGSVFRGRSIGAAGAAAGEVVFNTAMTGYQEILTDPSYCRQLVTLTYPHIGNTGANAEDEESARVYAEGLIVRDLPRLHSSWRAKASLSEYLTSHGIPGIADIDTRKLTRMLREKGAQNGCLMAGKVDIDEALKKAKGFPGLAGMDLAKVVTTKEPYEWREGRWEGAGGYRAIENPRFHVVAYDYGIKRNILRMLAERSVRVTVVPAAMPAREVLRMEPDGVFLSNGPGDPEPCDYAIEAIGERSETATPFIVRLISGQSRSGEMSPTGVSLSHSIVSGIPASGLRSRTCVPARLSCSSCIPANGRMSVIGVRRTSFQVPVPSPISKRALMLLSGSKSKNTMRRSGPFDGVEYSTNPEFGDALNESSRLYSVPAHSSSPSA